VADAWTAVPDAYQAAWAQLRAAEAALRAEGMRAGVDDILRSAHVTAIGLGASTLGREIEALARRARIDLEAAPAATGVAPEADAAPAGVAGGPGRRGKGVERPHGLSERELEVLALVAAGRTNGQIAEELFITRKTAAVHVTHILDKLGVSNRVEAAMIAARLGLATTAAGED
jgi:DNA-binding NarL/FixJ family response regulator